MVREYQGVIHEVMVVPGGFSWKEKIYPSLSAIALAMTGTSWNGPRFFGLRGGKGRIEAPVDQPPIGGEAPRPSTRSSVRSSGPQREAGRHGAGRRARHEDDQPEAAAVRDLHAQIDRT
jgi:Protein of unknown function (DUF2924)